jgi:hypothetical protein
VCAVCCLCLCLCSFVCASARARALFVFVLTDASKQKAKGAMLSQVEVEILSHRASTSLLGIAVPYPVLWRSALAHLARDDRGRRDGGGG